MPYQCDPCVCPEQHYRDSMSWRKAMITLLCRIADAISGALGPSVNVIFDPITALTPAAIGAAYALAVDLPDGTRSFTLVNQTDGIVEVSLDAGANTHYIMDSSQSITVNAYDIGRITSAVIHVKDGNTAPTAGYFYIYSMR